ENFIGNANGSCNTDAPACIKHFFDFGRTYPVPRGFDHCVFPADEIQKPFFIGFYEITRVTDFLSVLKFRRQEWIRPNHTSGQLSVTPVSQGNCRTSMDQLSDFTWFAWLSTIIYDQDLCIRYRLTHRCWATIQFLGREIGRTESLC